MSKLRIGVLSVEIHIPASQSLKDKRRVVKSLIERARSRFNVSAAEVEYHETWQRAQLGFVSVSTAAEPIEGAFRQIKNLIYEKAEVEILQSQIDWLS